MDDPTQPRAAGDRVLPPALCIRLVAAMELAMRTHAGCVEDAAGDGLGSRSLYLSGMSGDWDLDLVLLARPGQPGVHADLEAARPGSATRLVMAVAWDGGGLYRDEAGAGCEGVIAALESAARMLAGPPPPAQVNRMTYD
jgi:hypothetical protein